MHIGLYKGINARPFFSAKAEGLNFGATSTVLIADRLKGNTPVVLKAEMTFRIVMPLYHALLKT